MDEVAMVEEEEEDEEEEAVYTVFRDVPGP
jgi:hypothetical protein